MTYFRISNWVHNPARRKHRWRCVNCGRLVQDGSDVVVEKRGTRINSGGYGMGSLGFHAECWDADDHYSGGKSGVLARNNKSTEEV
jgi:hypothetical protein